MKLSFLTLGCPDWSIETIVEKAAEYGYDGVELRVKGDKHVDPALPYEERKRIRQLFNGKGLEIPCLAGYSFFCSNKEEILESNRKILMDNIILARDLGAPYVRTLIGHREDGVREEEVLDNASAYIRECGDYALKEGIGIVIETHDDYCSNVKIGKVLDRIDHKAVGVLWDIENNHECGETVGGFFNSMSSSIRHLHVRDSYRDSEGKFHICLSGKGAVPLKECKDILINAGYGGYVTFEWEKMWHPELEEPEVAFPHFIKYWKEL